MRRPRRAAPPGAAGRPRRRWSGRMTAKPWSPGMRPIFVPLRGRLRHPEDPFWRFVAGKKSVEVRQVTSTVARQVLRRQAGAQVLLRRGYSTKDEIHGELGRVWQAATWSTLPDQARLGADRHDADLPL